MTRVLNYLLLVSAVVFVGCEESETVEIGNWIERSDFEGVPRSGAVVFTINDLAYVGTGFDGDDRLKDFWVYDSELNFWQQIAEFPGVARNAAVSFSAGGKGYVGTGFDGDNELKDFWEYDPVTNTWDSIAAFGGSARYGAVGFSVNDKGYVGTGYDGNNLKDFWEYDPILNTWTQIVSITGGKRVDAFAFVINGEAYVGGGENNGLYEPDFFKYNPIDETWVKLTDLDDSDAGNDDLGLERFGATTFANSNYGYLISGTQLSTSRSIFRYNPFEDEWEEEPELEGAARTDAVGFSVRNRLFITTGSSGTARFDDIWEFQPDVESDTDD